MRTEGLLAPETAAAAREDFESVGPAARTVVREVLSATVADREAFTERMSGEVVATAQDALFASLLRVHVGSRTEFQEWCADYDGSVTEVGSEHVSRVVWHAFDGEAVAATFEDEPEAAVATLRRQAFGRLYREHL